jgi:hypothetical protein
MKTTPADSAKDFKASSNVKALRVIFTPASSEDSTATNRVKGLLEGVKVVEHGTYMVDKEETPEP